MLVAEAEVLVLPEVGVALQVVGVALQVVEVALPEVEVVPVVLVVWEVPAEEVAQVQQRLQAWSP